MIFHHFFSLESGLLHFASDAWHAKTANTTRPACEDLQLRSIIYSKGPRALRSKSMSKESCEREKSIESPEKYFFLKHLHSPENRGDQRAGRAAPRDHAAQPDEAEHPIIVRSRPPATRAAEGAKPAPVHVPPATEVAAREVAGHRAVRRRGQYELPRIGGCTYRVLFEDNDVRVIVLRSRMCHAPMES